MTSMTTTKNNDRNAWIQTGIEPGPPQEARAARTTSGRHRRHCHGRDATGDRGTSPRTSKGATVTENTCDYSFHSGEQGESGFSMLKTRAFISVHFLHGKTSENTVKVLFSHENILHGSSARVQYSFWFMFIFYALSF